MKLSRLNKFLLVILLSVILLCWPYQTYNQYEYAEQTTCNVLISFPKSPYPYDGFGTGNYINNKEYPYVLTCKHVAGLAEKIKIRYVGMEKAIDAKLVIISKSHDFAILQIEELPQDAKIAKYVKTLDTKLGDKLYYFGLIKQVGPTYLHVGHISQKYFKHHDNMQVNVVAGSSGATIFNEYGKGVGIVCAGNVADIATHCIYLTVDVIRQNLLDSKIPEIYNILDGKCDIKLGDVYKTPINLP